MPKADTELIEEYFGGNEKAFSELVDRYIKMIYNFVYRLTGNRNDAPDIVQEVFVKIWKNLKKYNPKQSFKTWVFAIARNTAIDWLRKRKVMVFSDLDNDDTGETFGETLSDDAPLADELFEKQETKEMVEDMLKEITFDQRTVVVLHHNEGMTFEEIAVVLGKPVNTLKSHYRRALMAMRKRLSESPSAPNQL